MLRDITLEVEAEKLKDNLIKSISHELLTPLVPMQTSLQFIQMMYSGESLPVQSHPNIARFVENHMNRPSFEQWINKDGFITL